MPTHQPIEEHTALIQPPQLTPGLDLVEVVDPVDVFLTLGHLERIELMRFLTGLNTGKEPAHLHQLHRQFGIHRALDQTAVRQYPGIELFLFLFKFFLSNLSG